MLTFFSSLAVWQMAICILGLRICDVTLNTIKTISVVQGRIPMAMVLGFFEVLIWISVVSQVIVHISDHPILGVAYAAGYACGNGIGIVIERIMAMGTSVIRLISQHQGYSVAEHLRKIGQGVTTFDGEGKDGHCLLIYAICPRKEVKRILQAAREVDPKVFFIVESVTQASTLRALRHKTGRFSFLSKHK